MSATFKTPGIVLFSRDYKEADRIYIIYTQNYGKISARAQGVRKINSKLAGHLEPLSESDLFIANAKHFSKIGGASLINSNKKIKANTKKVEVASFIAQIINKSIFKFELKNI